MISPLTTLVEAVAAAAGDTSPAGIAAANATVLTAFGLTTATDLTSFDAETNLLSTGLGSAALVAAAQVFEADNYLQSAGVLITAAGGSVAATTAAIAAALAAGQTLDLTDPATLFAKAGLPTAVTSALTNIASATINALQTQLAGGASPSSAFQDVSGGSLADQRDAAPSVAAATQSGSDAAFQQAAASFVAALPQTLAADDSEVPCYAAGTLIATPGGDVAVENLSVGDAVLTQASGAASIIWIGTRRVDCARHPQPEKVQPIRIQAGAFGRNIPRRDLFLSPDHAVFAEGVLIPAKHLVNGTTITINSRNAVTYYHVELDCHDVLLAERLPCESYLDNGSRAAFANGGGATQLHPDFGPAERCEATGEALGCAPLRIVGPEVDRVRARLRRRAAKMGYDTQAKPHRKASLGKPAALWPDLTMLLQANWYLAANPDVATAGIDPAEHYARHGRQEGRLPCPEADLIQGLGLVDPNTVIRTMPDVIAAGIDPAVHFCVHGCREGRRPNAYFDTAWYSDTHAVPAGMNPLVHYVLLGEAAGLMPSPNFDPVWYRRHYGVGATVCVLAHYLAHRRTQQFSPIPSFDVVGYVAAHAATCGPAVTLMPIIWRSDGLHLTGAIKLRQPGVGHGLRPLRQGAYDCGWANRYSVSRASFRSSRPRRGRRIPASPRGTRMTNTVISRPTATRL